MNIRVDYDSSLTSLTFYDLYNKISDAVKAYETNNLGVFNNGFYLSKFSSIIDDSDNSIQNNDTDILIEKIYNKFQ